MTVATDLEEMLANHRSLVRELDVLLNGEAGAARQASLCDIVAQAGEFAADARRLRKLLQHCTDAKISYDKKTQDVSRLRMDFKASVETSQDYRDALRKSIDDLRATYEEEPDER